jgi:G3E family GTPase
MSMQDETTRHIPVNILTGFLGSGKTTLLKRLLSSPAFANCAVLINELGEIALDHQLLEHIDQETIVLQSGCICCSIRDDLQRALLDLYEKCERGIVPPFSRVIIETTGLADPVPVLNTIVADPVLRHHFRLGNVATTVDAVNGFDQLQRQAESRKQAAVADRLVITKADLVKAEQLNALETALRQINASALLVTSWNNADDGEILLAEDVGQTTRSQEVRRWFAADRVTDAGSGHLPTRIQDSMSPGLHHRSDISTLSLVFDNPINWIAFGVWLSMLLHRWGQDILRVKGILNVQGSPLPVVVHGVQHLIHPPMHLDAWPDDDRRSRLILIGNLPPAEQIQDSLDAFNH